MPQLEPYIFFFQGLVSLLNILLVCIFLEQLLHPALSVAKTTRGLRVGKTETNSNPLVTFSTAEKIKASPAITFFDSNNKFFSYFAFTSLNRAHNSLRTALFSRRKKEIRGCFFILSSSSAQTAVNQNVNMPGYQS